MMRAAFSTMFCGKRMLLERVVADAGAQPLDVDPAVQAEQPADAVEREAEAELDGLELRGDDDEQGEAALLTGQPGFEQADRLERDAILELELEKAGVTAFVGLEAQEATALEAAAVDDEADAFGRLEAEVEREVAEGAGGLARAAFLRFELQPDVVDHGEQRAELQAEPRADPDDDLGRVWRRPWPR